MVHARALPGTPGYDGNLNNVIRTASSEAKQLVNAGFDSILVENMHDAPYLKGAVGPEITAAMAVIVDRIKQYNPVPVGIQILAGANQQALAAALASGADYIRVEGYVFAHVADEGIIESSAGELLRYRKNIGAEHILVFADIKKKHSSHSITADTSLTDMAEAADFFGADGIIVTGSSTGKTANTEDLSLLQNSRLPVLVGSGISAENLNAYWNAADGFIVGSYIKEEGYWKNDLSDERIGKMVEAANSLR